VSEVPAGATAAPRKIWVVTERDRVGTGTAWAGWCAPMKEVAIGATELTLAEAAPAGMAPAWRATSVPRLTTTPHAARVTDDGFMSAPQYVSPITRTDRSRWPATRNLATVTARGATSFG
jgi:hypothetical protein